MTATHQGTSVLTAVKEGVQFYVALQGDWDTFWGPEPDQYAVTDSVEDAARFTPATGKIDIDVIDAKKFLPGYSWSKKAPDS